MEHSVKNNKLLKIITLSEPKKKTKIQKCFKSMDQALIYILCFLLCYPVVVITLQG